MARIMHSRTLQKFAAIHTSVQNDFNQDRHLDRHNIFKQNGALASPNGVNWRHEVGVSGEFGDRFALE